MSASAPQAIYATTSANLFFSVNAGESWTTLAVPHSSIDQLAVDPSDSAVVYIIGQKHTYRSDDGGATWKDLTPRLGTVSTLAIRIDPAAPSTPYIGARCDMYRFLPMACTSRRTAATLCRHLDRHSIPYR